MSIVLLQSVAEMKSCLANRSKFPAEVKSHIYSQSSISRVYDLRHTV